MAYLSYNGVSFGNRILSLGYEASPFRDPSGSDYECTRVVISVQSLVNPYWLPGTNKRIEDGYGIESEGDRAGRFLWAVKKLLAEDRGTLVYRIGQDTVLESPERLAGNDRLAHDIRGGPKVLGLKITENVGDKTLLIQWSCETFVTHRDSNNYLLSNRWAYSQTLDDSYYPTVVLRGRASFRKDFLTELEHHPDDFRDVVIPPPDPNMQRVHVSSSIDPGGMELTWEAVDKALNYSLFDTHGIVHMSLQATAGVYTIKPDMTPSAVMGRAMSLGRSVEHGIRTRDPAGILGHAATFLDWLTPQGSLSVTARAVGKQGASRAKMLLACQQMALSRHFLAGTPNANAAQAFLNKIKPLGFNVTMGWDTKAPPTVEFGADFLVTSTEALIGNTIGLPFQMNMSDEVNAAILDVGGVIGAKLYPVGLSNGGVLDMDAGSKLEPGAGKLSPPVPLGENATRAKRAYRAFSQVLLAAGLDGADALPDRPVQPGEEGRESVAPEASPYEDE